MAKSKNLLKSTSNAEILSYIINQNPDYGVQSSKPIL